MTATTVFSDDFERWDRLIRDTSSRHGVPWRWVKAVMWIESDLGRDPRVFNKEWSRDGKSRGLMQVTLTTAQELRPGTTSADLDNPEISVDLGTRYLKKMIVKFGIGDRESVIRAYNGGPGFRSTVAGQTQTPIYYARFVEKLTAIQLKQPGDELEVG